MNASVYYFSGTGNSLWAAKTLAEYLDADPIPMARHTDGITFDENSTAVLVFPVYNHLIPYLMQRFIDHVDFHHRTAIYAVCTYGDSPGISLEYCKQRVEKAGGTLRGGFGIQMPYNYISPTASLSSVFKPFQLRETSGNKQAQMFDAARRKLQTVADSIRSGQSGTLETEYEWIEHLSDRLHLRDTLQKRFWLRKAGYRGKAQMTSVECVQLMDVGFFATGACTGCQTCAQVCPVNNIRFTGHRPVWQHRCEQCFACLQWCPAQAIQFGQGTQGGKRYHCPMIGVNEMKEK